MLKSNISIDVIEIVILNFSLTHEIITFIQSSEQPRS